MEENENFLIDKLYDKYQMEISRREKVENKAVGYYTVLGISLAAFLVIVPMYITTYFDLTSFWKWLLTLLISLISLWYVGLVSFSTILLHKVISPKVRGEFDPIENWKILKEKERSVFIDLVKDNLSEIIREYEGSNKSLVEKLEIVNYLMVIANLLILASFIILVARKFIN